MPPYRQSTIKQNLHLRARIIQFIRQYFTDRDYLEVETPVRTPAPAPEEHIDAVTSEGWYLQTSPELCMKRLIAAGYPRLFQICKCFRKGERGRLHLPELTLLEWYTVNHDYVDLMNQCEDLVVFIVRRAKGRESLTYQGKEIHLKRPWLRLTISEAFERYAAMSISEAWQNDMFEEIMVNKIEPALPPAAPVFLHDYPAFCAALARHKPNAASLAERFELYIGGLELCNGFSELTDPVEQRIRFKKEMAARRDAHKTVTPMPEQYLKALADVPEAAGTALGIDRLVMLLTNSATIDEVVSFIPEEL